MNEVFVKSYAKVNLSLDVIGLRADGYHNISSVMQSVDWYDHLSIRKTTSPFSLQILNSDKLPNTENNLVTRAARLISSYAKFIPNVHITLNKSIPIGAGLAGGSSDAAGTLIGLNALFDIGLEDWELRKLALQIGSDVPFCLSGGTALAEGRGEILSKVENLVSGHLVLYKPAFSVSTARVYSKYDSTVVTHHPNNQALLEAIKKGSVEYGYPFMKNVLEQVTISEHPELLEIKEKMISAGAAHVLMTGSGPTLMAFVDHADQKEQLCQAVATLPGEYRFVSFIGQGQEIYYH